MGSVRKDMSKVESKVGSLDYAKHKPGGGDKKIPSQRLDFSNAKSKIGANDNLAHKPQGGDKKVCLLPFILQKSFGGTSSSLASVRQGHFCRLLWPSLFPCPIFVRN